jgi:hypothetical protein
MNLRLHLLETFAARGSDGQRYKVRAYERLAPALSLTGSGEQWEPTGVAEYHLEDGRLVEVDAAGTMRIHASDVTLEDERGGAKSQSDSGSAAASP